MVDRRNEGDYWIATGEGERQQRLDEGDTMPRKGDGLYLRGSVWYLDCRINGTRHVAKLGKNIKRSVAAELANVKRAAILRGEAGIRKRRDCPFEKAMAAFLDWAKTNKRPRTLRVYTQQIKRLSESFKGKKLSQISSFDVEKHKRSRVEQGARVTVNRELAILRNLYNRAKSWGLYEGDNPAMGVRMLEEPKRRLRFLDHAEEAKLLQVAPEPLHSLIIVGTNTGIRIGSEALTLKWPDVDLGRGILTVQAAYSKNKESRSIPLNSRAKEAFRYLSSVRRSDYVFSQINGRPYKSMEKPFAKACEDAGLSGTGVSLHTLRHTFASNLVMAGVDVETVRQYGGWSDLSLVQRYAHLSPNHKAKSIEKIVESFHNTIHNSPNSSTVVDLAERRATV